MGQPRRRKVDPIQDRIPINCLPQHGISSFCVSYSRLNSVQNPNFSVRGDLSSQTLSFEERKPSGLCWTPAVHNSSDKHNKAFQPMGGQDAASSSEDVSTVPSLVRPLILLHVM